MYLSDIPVTVYVFINSAKVKVHEYHDGQLAIFHRYPAAGTDRLTSTRASPVPLALPT